QPCRTVRGLAEDVQAIWRIANIPQLIFMSVEHCEFNACIRIPYSDSLVLTSCNDPLTARGECRTIDEAVMPGEHQQPFPSECIPNICESIVGGGNYPGTIRGEARAIYVIVVR